MNDTNTAIDTDFSYTLTRTLDASVARVWEAWTTPDQYERWANAAPGSVVLDVRTGGAWSARMRTPDGAEFPLTGSYLDVVEPERLVIGMDVPPRDDPEVIVMTLAEQDGKTVLTVSQTSDTAADRDMAEQGSNILLDGLESYLTAS